MSDGSIWSQMKGVVGSWLPSGGEQDWWKVLRAGQLPERIAAAQQLGKCTEDFWGDYQRKLAQACLEESAPEVRTVIAEALKNVVKNGACQKGSPGMEVMQRALDDRQTPPERRLLAMRVLKLVWTIDPRPYLHDPLETISLEAAKYLGAKSKAEALRLRDSAMPQQESAWPADAPIRRCPLPSLPPGSNWTVFEEDNRDRFVTLRVVPQGFAVASDSLRGPDVRQIDFGNPQAFDAVRFQPPASEPKGTPFSIVGQWQCHGCGKQRDLSVDCLLGAEGVQRREDCPCGRATIVGVRAFTSIQRDHYAYAAAYLRISELLNSEVKLLNVKVQTEADVKRQAAEWAARISRTADDPSRIGYLPHDSSKATRRARQFRWISASGAAVSFQATDYPGVKDRLSLDGTHRCQACGGEVSWVRSVIWYQNLLGVKETCPHCRARFNVDLRTQEYDPDYPPAVWILVQPEGFRAEIVSHPIEIAVTNLRSQRVRG